jgi:hypothetical protein
LPTSCAQAAVTPGTPAFSIFSRSQRRADHGAIATNLVRRTLRHATEQNRIVAVVDRLDVEHRFGPQVAGVVAGPFGEWPFDALVAGLDEALEHDLGIGRDR